MARFYVGCRVRMVEGGYVSGSNREAIGMEGVISPEPPEAGWDWVVAAKSGELWNATERCLEPIIPEGHQVISWEEMADLWTPEKVGA